MAPMSDETKEKGTIDGAPTAFVRGGGATGTAASEALYERRFQEAEKRRDEADAEKKLASIPIDQGGAQLHTSQLTANPEIPKAFLLLDYVDRKGEPIVVNGEPVRCMADLIIGMNPLNPEELAIVLVCPRCEQTSHKHQQDNQLMLRQSNRRFEFKPGLGPPDFVFQGKRYKSAGQIVASETFTCGDCGWKARIDKNRVWPD